MHEPTHLAAGKDRWDIKTGTDADVTEVTSAPVSSTIAQLIALPAPHQPTVRTPAEQVTYSIPCTITFWKIEADGDHHLVLTDESGKTMIGEIPDPQFVGPTSPWLSEITTARTQFDTWPRLNKPCIVTGVCFFDHLHGQTGVAPNGVELHPILSIVDPAGGNNDAV
jgi:hypothetical protein